MRPEFRELFEGFNAFADDHQIGAIRPNQWEVTYVNHIPRGAAWSEPADWASLFRGLPSITDSPEDIRLESFGSEWHFEIAPQRGRLHMDLKHARAGGPSGPEVLRLTVTARGAARDAASLYEGVDIGRSAIVRTFRAATSDRAHQLWELIS